MRPHVPHYVLAVSVAWAAACAGPDLGPPEHGVALALAERRAAAIDSLRYDLHFRVPLSRDSAVTGDVGVTFRLRGWRGDLPLDFRAPADHVLGVELDGDTVTATVVNDRIVLPAARLGDGEHRVRVRFRSSDAALNRNVDFLYALFVPDRASTAVPVFEQPDLKARVTLSLDLPAAWEAVANGPMVSRTVGVRAPLRSEAEVDSSRALWRFAETEPLSTYLIAFAAGKLQKVTAVRAGRTFNMYHRETDRARVDRNREAIFDLHAGALEWLERYTDIAYPFGKFDFFAVPAFQFGGMEHPGAIWYRADALFLDEAPSRTAELSRASLIAHETAHMWFGDLVTMRWFNDVWMKEVFANFMAAKIVEPAFPDVNHALRFFQSHHPSAYAVDRTAGANPIRQDLENLREAGSLYGAIIYQKAPIIMKQLELAVGEEAFRDGLRRYLAAHAFGNATWNDLIAELDPLTDSDLRAWSRVWVESPGRPRISTAVVGDTLIVRQEDRWSDGRDLQWPQQLNIQVGYRGPPTVIALTFRAGEREVRTTLPSGADRHALLPGADGASYARFPLSDSTRSALLVGAATLADPLGRAIAWQTLHEEMLEGLLSPRILIDVVMDALSREENELVASQLLGQLRGIYWRYLSDSSRRALSPLVEATLWEALERAPTPGRKGSLFGSIINVTLTETGLQRLERIWRRTEKPIGFPVSEQQEIAIAEGLAIRGRANAEEILDVQTKRLTNPDRIARAQFVRAALSADPARRDSLFQTFRQVEQRRRESWVLDAMAMMHHPLRAEGSLGQLRPALELTAEIQRTGDIFFPLRWLNTTLDGHHTGAAADTVTAFLQENPGLPPRLRGKVLQAADELFRSARVVNGWVP
ncbi:MAG: M1 family metallopeptidase [Gemmatimonadaceae bacterium]